MHTRTRRDFVRQPRKGVGGERAARDKIMVVTGSEGRRGITWCK